MPNGIFASQFGYSNPYDPVGLETGMPTVGATLGKKRPGKPKEPVDETANPRATGGSAASGQIAAGNAQGLSAANGAAAGLAAQGNRNKMNALMHAMDMRDNAAAPSSTFGGGDFSRPTTSTSGAQVNHPAPSGFWGSLGHSIASGFDTVRHGAAHVGDILGQTFQEQNSFGEPQFQSKDYHQSVPTNNHNPITGIAQHGQPTDMQQFINRPGGRYTDIPGISANNRGLGVDMPGSFLEEAPRQVQKVAAASAPEAAQNWWDNINPAQFLETAAKDVEQDA